MRHTNDNRVHQKRMVQYVGMDCGKCLNCTNKPKFGGNGVRKQRCSVKVPLIPFPVTFNALCTQMYIPAAWTMTAKNQLNAWKITYNTTKIPFFPQTSWDIFYLKN